MYKPPKTCDRHEAQWPRGELCTFIALLNISIFATNVFSFPSFDFWRFNMVAGNDMWDQATDSRDREQDGPVIEINIVTGGEISWQGTIQWVGNGRILLNLKTFMLAWSFGWCTNILRHNIRDSSGGLPQLQAVQAWPARNVSNCHNSSTHCTPALSIYRVCYTCWSAMHCNGGCWGAAAHLMGNAD